MRRKITSRSSATRKIISCCRYRLRRTEYVCPFRYRTSIEKQTRPSGPPSKTRTGWLIHGEPQLKKMTSSPRRFASRTVRVSYRGATSPGPR